MPDRIASLLSLLLCLVSGTQLHGQPPTTSGQLQVRFTPVIDGRPLVLSAEPAVADSLRITMLRCYISRIELSQGGKAVWREPDSYHLLDAENAASLELKLYVPAGLGYDSIHFMLGIDSAVSASGAHGGELDPVNGMYWAWQSGYINFKLEGLSPTSNARKHQFHFHLGGYQSPYAAAQKVSLKALPQESLVISMNLSGFLEGIDFAKQNSVMIPGAEAAALSKKAAGIFQIQ